MSASDVRLILKMIGELTERVAALEAASSEPCAAELPAVPEAAPSPDDKSPRPRSAYGRYLSAKEAEA